MIDSHPGPSSPDGDEALVLRAPTAAALRFIAATATCCPPSMSASMFAASLPDTISRAASSWRVVYGWPGSSPTQEHSTSVWDWLARAKLSGRRLSSTTIASSGLIVLAGACWADGSCEARIRPESRSASSHACAGPSGSPTAPDGWIPGSADAVGQLTAELANASPVTNAANIFRTGAERIPCSRWI